MKKHIYYIDEWNDLHCKYIQLGADIRNDMMAGYCEEMMIKAKEAYYDSDSPIMEDNTYDWFEDRLKILRPDSKVLEKVGS